jgi:protein-disulfide isomerase
MTAQSFGWALDRLATLALLFAAGFTVWRVNSYTEPYRELSGDMVESIEAVLPGDVRNRVSTKGAATAGLAVIEISDFECPYCAQAARDIHPQLDRDFVETNRVVYVFLHLPIEALHPHAVKAAQAADCSGHQGRFWDMHRVLFANRRALTDASLRGYATAIGLDRMMFDTCLNAPATADAVTADIELARRLGANSTPQFLLGFVRPDGTVLVTKRLVGALPYQIVRQAIKDELKHGETD